MDNKLSKKLGFVLKAKIIKEMNLDNKERRKWLNKSKREIIDYCLNNNIFTPEKINELYNSSYIIYIRILLMLYYI